MDLEETSQGKIGKFLIKFNEKFSTKKKFFP